MPFGISQSMWKKVPWLRLKLSLFAVNGNTRGTLTLYQEKLLPVKHGGGSIMLWECLSSGGLGDMFRTEETTDGVKYKKILEENPFESSRKTRPGQKSTV